MSGLVNSGLVKVWISYCEDVGFNHIDNLAADIYTSQYQAKSIGGLGEGCEIQNLEHLSDPLELMW